ncbi:glycine-rich domain-containing protein [Rhodophyticola porphyridii]|uniref:glycine-rich domain-containing protein n=1 Tax=Rhodophyticola porphyridii TaxID=1852017 RepID=UPI0011C3DE6A|nr:hypothetical protein [Rhodophyticola porphyridii]
MIEHIKALSVSVGVVFSAATVATAQSIFSAATQETTFSSTGSQSLTLEHGEVALIVAVGGGGGGGHATRYHDRVRVGGGGASGEIELYTISTEESEARFNIDVEIGVGGRGGGRILCELRGTDWGGEAGAGENGSPTVVTISTASENTDVVTVEANGGRGGGTPFNSSTCWGGDCENGAGFILQSKPLGGLAQSTGVSGSDGIANAEIIRGTTIIAGVSGGELPIGFGSGGDSGTYDATRGVVTNPPGSGYAPYDNRDWCDGSQTFFGRHGSDGGVIIYVFNGIDAERLIAEATYELIHEQNSSEEQAIEFLENPTYLYNNELFFNPLSQSEQQEVAEAFQSSKTTEAWGLLSSSYANATGTVGPDLTSLREPEVSEAGVGALLANPTVQRLLWSATIWMINQSHVHQQQSGLNPDFAGVSTQELNESLAALAQAHSAVAYGVEHLGGRNPHNILLLDDLEDRIEILVREIRVRAEREIEAHGNYMESQRGLGGAPVFDGLSPEELQRRASRIDNRMMMENLGGGSTCVTASTRSCDMGLPGTCIIHQQRICY